MCCGDCDDHDDDKKDLKCANTLRFQKLCCGNGERERESATLRLASFSSHEYCSLLFCLTNQMHKNCGFEY